MKRISGRIATPDGVLDPGTVHIEDGRITGVTSGVESGTEVHEGFVLPGFVDLQVNGAFGLDVVEQPESIPALSRELVRTGTTSYLPTVISLPKDDYPDLLSKLSENMTISNGCAEPLGLHLEGPFLNPEKAGAHDPQNMIPPDVDFLEAAMRLARIRLVTLAPELPNALDVLPILRENGIVASVGHSMAGFDQATEAFEGGFTSVTHLFNAMSPLHHRDPGIPGATFDDGGVMCGLIADGIHVHPAAVRLAYRTLGPERISLVTDAVAAAGMPEGEHVLAGRRVIVGDGAPTLPDGTLAGSTLATDQALRNIIAFTGCGIAEAAKMLATTPAALIGASKKGRISEGFDADLVLISPDLAVEEVFIGGERAFTSESRI